MQETDLEMKGFGLQSQVTPSCGGSRGRNSGANHITPTMQSQRSDWSHLPAHWLLQPLAGPAPGLTHRKGEPSHPIGNPESPGSCMQGEGCCWVAIVCVTVM